VPTTQKLVDDIVQEAVTTIQSRLAKMVVPARKSMATATSTTAATTNTASTSDPTIIPEDDLNEEIGWVTLDEVSPKLTEEQEVELARRQLGISGLTSLKHAKKDKAIGVFLSKFDPLTLHHEETIESALKAGIFDKIVVVPSDVTAEILHTPLVTRQNIINTRYQDDPRVISFLAHSFQLKNSVLGWVSDIVQILRDSDYTPVSVFLAEDFLDKAKKGRLVSMVPGDKYLVLYGVEEEKEANAIPPVDEETGKPIVKFQFKKPPKSAEVREYLAKNQDTLFSNEGLLKDNNIPLSLTVKQYIYKNQLYKSQLIAGNVTDAFRNVFGTGLGTLLGRVEAEDQSVNEKVKAKLASADIFLKKRKTSEYGAWR